MLWSPLSNIYNTDLGTVGMLNRDHSDRRSDTAHHLKRVRMRMLRTLRRNANSGRYGHLEALRGSLGCHVSVIICKSANSE